MKTPFDAKKIERLIGREVVQICIGRHEFILNMFPRSSIAILGIERFFEENAKLFIGEVLNTDAILGTKILEMKYIEGSSVTVYLEGEINLVISNDSEIYESAVFLVDGEEIVL